MFQPFQLSTPLPQGCVVIQLPAPYTPKDRADVTYYSVRVGYVGGQFKCSVDEKTYALLGGREGEAIQGQVVLKPWEDQWKATLVLSPTGSAFGDAAAADQPVKKRAF